MENEYLVKLRKASYEAEQALHGLALCNTNGLDVDERVKLDVDIELARRKRDSARREYEKAVDNFCESSTG